MYSEIYLMRRNGAKYKTIAEKYGFTTENARRIYSRQAKRKTIAFNKYGISNLDDLNKSQSNIVDLEYQKIEKFISNALCNPESAAIIMSDFGSAPIFSGIIGNPPKKSKADSGFKILGIIILSIFLWIK